MALAGYQLLDIPEAAVRVMVHLRWCKAEAESREDMDEFTPADKLVEDEFSYLHYQSKLELSLAFRLDSYTVDPMDEEFDSRLNDSELYSFLGLMYLSRLFESPENRLAFLRKTAGFREEQLMEIVEQGSLRYLLFEKPCASAMLKSNEILECTYFTHQPQRYNDENECFSPLLKYLRQRIAAFKDIDDDDRVRHAGVLITHFQELESEIVNLYKLAVLGPRRSSKYENPPFTFSSRRLLGAARNNGFFFDLISKRPPHCAYISHEQALLECAEHARLWLMNAKLPVYYNFKPRYCDLARTPSGDEQEAWKSPAGYGAVLLSTKEKRLRRSTLARYGLRGDDVCNLTPEDYVDVADNREGNIAKFLAFPVYKEDYAVHENIRLAEQLGERIERVELDEKYKALEKMAKEWGESKMEAFPRLITEEQLQIDKQGSPSSKIRYESGKISKKRKKQWKLQACATTTKKRVPQAS